MVSNSLSLGRVDSEYGISKFTEDDEVALKDNTIITTCAESTLECYRDMTDTGLIWRLREVMLTYNIHDPHVYHAFFPPRIWTPRDIRSVEPGAENRNVKSVKSLALCYEPRYAINDFGKQRRL